MSAAEHVHFLRPEWLWLLAAAPILYWLVRRREDARSRWRGVIAPHLLNHLLVGGKRRWRIRPVHLICLGLALAALGLAGPAWEREKPPFTQEKAPLVIALDLSRTMDAVDVQPTRLERAKLKVQDLLVSRPGARTALFAYAGSAHMVLPLTDDAGLFKTYLAALSTSIMPVPGKDTATALKAVNGLLSREESPGTVLFLTDGVEPSAFSALAASKKSQVMVLGVGTPEGGPVRSGPGQFLTDQTGARVFSKLDVDGLKALGDAGVPVATLTPDDADVKWVLRKAQSHLEVVQQADARLRWKDEGYWLVIPITLLMALWFRKGWTLRWSP
jgi:Ca-activated chloride channel family protein